MQAFLIKLYHDKIYCNYSYYNKKTKLLFWAANTNIMYKQTHLLDLVNAFFFLQNDKITILYELRKYL